jgi:acetyltransferase-like isoleucine patch superfamily enzyme
MKKLISKILLRLIDDDIVNLIQNKFDENVVKKNELMLTKDLDSKLYPEAKVFNIQGKKEAILLNQNAHIRGELLVFGYGGKIEIGRNSYIGEGTRIWSASSVTIGNDVLISHGCNIIDTDSHEINHIERAEGFINLIKQGHSKTNLNIKSKPIVIEDNAWLSYNVSVMKGVKIGKGAIIGAGSLVTKDVPEFTLWAGNPAKELKKLT